MLLSVFVKRLIKWLTNIIQPFCMNILYRVVLGAIVYERSILLSKLLWTGCICVVELLPGLVYWVLNRSNVLTPGGGRRAGRAVLGHSLGKCVGKRPLGPAAVVPWYRQLMGSINRIKPQLLSSEFDYETVV